MEMGGYLLAELVEDAGLEGILHVHHSQNEATLLKSHIQHLVHILHTYNVGFIFSKNRMTCQQFYPKES